MQDGSLQMLASRIFRDPCDSSGPSVPGLWDPHPRGLSYPSCDHNSGRRISLAPDGAALSDASLSPVASALSPGHGGKPGPPHGACGLDVMAVIGTLCLCDHRSVPDTHQALLARGLWMAEPSATGGGACRRAFGGRGATDPSPGKTGHRHSGH